MYLASQDNPEQGLCPTLRPPKEASKALLNHLTFESSHPDPLSLFQSKRSKGQTASSTPKCKPHPRSGRPQSPVSRRSEEAAPRSINKGQRRNSNGDQSEQSLDAGKITASDYTHKIRAGPANKDHRSFAANLFGTVAFRMLEWLTPQGMAAISNKLDMSDILGEPAQNVGSSLSGSSSTTPETATEINSPSKPPSVLNGEPPEKLVPPEPLNPSPRDPTKSRRSPEAMFRSPQSSKPRRRASLEPPSPAKVEEPKSPTKSPRLNGFHPEKLTRTLKSNSAAVSRGIPEIPAKPAFFGNITSHDTVVVNTTDSDRVIGHEPSEAHTDLVFEPHPKSRIEKPDKADLDEIVNDPTAASIQNLLPQSLSRMNTDLVDFVCDVFEKDNTGELPADPDSHESCPQPLRGRTPFVRKRMTHDVVSRRQWKAFNEQTLFSVLSDPRSLISSFTSNNDLLDSHTLWYCMYRLTRAAPSLVFHSLWMAADSLFVPPKALQVADPKKANRLTCKRDALSDYEAGCLMSICLHALAGSAPICPDGFSLALMTWIRSAGLTLSTFEDRLKQPSWLRENYDDAFSNDLAVRLARRLCCAITARRRFASMLEADEVPSDRDDGSNTDDLDPDSDRIDVLDGLFNQIDISGRETTPVLEFPENLRQRHYKLMPFLILEWARTVMFSTWDGKPDFCTNGPFAGALLLIKSMCKSMCPEFRMTILTNLFQMINDNSWTLLGATSRWNISLIASTPWTCR